MSRTPDGGFDPSVPAPGEAGTGSTTGYLPNGQYDIYDLGALWNKTLFLGYTKEKPEPTTVDITSLAAKAAAAREAAAPAVISPVLSTPLAYMKEFAGWSVTDPQQYAALQQQLYFAGFYGASKPKFGIWSTDDATAMKDAITGYLGVVNTDSPQPLTLNDYLDHASAQGRKNDKQEQQASAPPIQLTDPASIRAAAQAAFEAALGRTATDGELGAFVEQFQASQTTAQQQAVNENTNSFSMPDLTAEAGAYAQESNPKEFARNQRQSYVSALVNMFAPAGSTRPDQTPVAPA